MIEFRAMPVPNGFEKTVSGPRARVTVSIPFACDDDTFTQLPTVLLDWPASLRRGLVSLKIGVKDGAGAATAVSFHPDWDSLNSDLWTRLIVRDRHWQRQTKDADPPAPQSYSVRSLVDILTTTRALDAVSCTSLDAPPKNGALEAASSALNGLRGDTRVSPEVAAFHGIGQDTPPGKRSLFVRSDSAANEIEQLLPTFQKSPLLARRLGIVIDFVADDAGSLPQEGFVTCEVQVSNGATGLSVAAEQSSVAVAFEYDSAQLLFLPRARSAKTPGSLFPKSGLFVMRGDSPQDDPFFVTTVDYVGGAFKELSFPPSKQAPGRSLIGAHDAAPAADRTVGFSINENQAAVQFVTSQANAATRIQQAEQARRANKPIKLDPLFAEDLLVGVRPDVLKSGGGSFRSLCEVKSDYLDVDDTLLASEESEQFVERCITRDVHAEGGSVFVSTQPNLHEALVHWGGWSVSAPRPGKVVEGAAPAPPDKLAFFKKKLTAKPKSLERLRYRKSYEFRLRAAFLGGVGPTRDDVDRFATASSQQLRSRPAPFDRAEPIGSPRIFSKDAFAPGESLLGITVRRKGLSHTASTRYILPPPAAIDIAEYSGEFDQQTFTWYKTLQHQFAGDGAFDIVGDYLPDPWATRMRVEVRIVARCGDRPNPQSSDGGTVTSVDSCTDGVTRFEVLFRDADSKWPRLKAFKLRCNAIQSGPSWFKKPPPVAPSGYALELNLAPGDHYELKLQTIADPANRDHFAITRTLKDAVAGAHPRLQAVVHSAILRPFVDATIAALDDGGHAMVAPSVTLTATHVTPAPAIAPAFGDPHFHRELYATIATLSDTLMVDGATSGSLTVDAKWNDWVDDRARPKLFPVAGHTAAHTVPVDRDASVVELHDPADPKKSPSHAVQLQFPDTDARICTIAAIATSRFPEHFPGPSKPGDGTLGSAGVDLIVPASAPPRSVEVAFCASLDTWERKRTNSQFRSHRASRTIRVYLRRGWRWGEMLGVLCWPSATETLSQKQRNILAKYVTQWGADPLVVTADLPEGPYSRHFPAATAHADGIQPLYEDQNGGTAEVLGLKLTDLRVSVAAHEVHFDETRQLWFADVEVDLPDIFMPWVKFSFARFQPHALPTCHLSIPLLSQYSQLSVDRVVTVSRIPSDPGYLLVTMSGPVAQRGLSFETKASARLLRPMEEHTPTLVQPVGSEIALHAGDSVNGIGSFSGAIRIEDDSRHLLLEVREDFVETAPGNPSPLSKPVFIEHVDIASLLS